MILGISGKQNSGKDLVGSIIQYLYYVHSDIDEDRKLSYESFIKTNRTNNLLISNNIPTIIKFADKLKDIVCILLSCTREQLEDRVYKETPLGEEWWKYEQYDTSDEKWRHTSFEFYNKYKNNNYAQFRVIKLTPRLLLQLIGTECGRQIIHPNIWVNAAMANYKDGSLIHIGGNNYITEQEFRNDNCNIESNYSIDELVESNRIISNWIITDVRFPNEAKAITDKGGINIRIKRDQSCTVCGLTKTEHRGKQCNEITCPNGRQQHESETALDHYEFTHVINNNGTIEELIERVKEILLIEKII